MKKILIIILSVISVNLFSATEPFQVTLELLEALTITEQSALDFGAHEVGANTYTVNPNTSSANRASFDIAGSVSQNILVSVQEASISLSDGSGHTISVGTFTISDGSNGSVSTLDGTGAATAYVGATATVGTQVANPAGSYSGTATLEVIYN